MYAINCWWRGNEVLLRWKSNEFVLRWIRNERLLRNAYALFLGQVVSFLVAFSSFFTSSVIDLGVNVPLTQSFFAYLCLVLVFGTIRLGRRQNIRVSWIWYLFLGFVDVQGNYLVKKAYQYSSATSVTLLDCWTIPWAMIFTWIVLGTRYSIRQFFGAALCVAGLASVFLSDAGAGGGGGSKPILGDTLVVAGTLFLAMSNVGEEFCVKKKDSVEVVAMIGAFGLLVSACEIYIMEFETLKSIKWSPDIILGLAGHVLSTFLFYTLVPFLLKLSGATMLSLSLLTSDLWAVVIRVYFYHQKVDWLYYLSFATITIGLIIYSKDEGSSNISVFEDQNLNAQYQELNEGSAGCKNETSS
ncbi:hypothetical protein VitviT2T_012560 [Vitis vinifera]|uniref:Solute carrier family 35 member F1 n=1 Tax=Vitis vinifera TaxID=29760 RepID=A0ABY9CHI7_VITVI|nr:uncharacterized protein LOC104880146 [Vitis vinifera]WJZ93635.1 hypothetical protein VitviT2T_012560 [Vitis vinifera]|eukprot:XP_010654066.1 PREDICTED: solute carrier family 35 member F1 [Vitis vinifera]